MKLSEKPLHVYVTHFTSGDLMASAIKRARQGLVAAVKESSPECVGCPRITMSNHVDMAMCRTNLAIHCGKHPDIGCKVEMAKIKAMSDREIFSMCEDDALELAARALKADTVYHDSRHGTIRGRSADLIIVDDVLGPSGGNYAPPPDKDRPATALDAW